LYIIGTVWDEDEDEEDEDEAEAEVGGLDFLFLGD
jgi:hypothetical protein